ncbi:hypothetical protein DL96DRAFT_493271 [Flagelloscypha sp. PMI_526]|nr:hypothetical protein DL96DRAFT_493271 [Flagelloscypha sp. PMI_526]
MVDLSSPFSYSSRRRRWTCWDPSPCPASVRIRAKILSVMSGFTTVGVLLDMRSRCNGMVIGESAGLVRYLVSEDELVERCCHLEYSRYSPDVIQSITGIQRALHSGFANCQAPALTLQDFRRLLLTRKSSREATGSLSHMNETTRMVTEDC